MLIKRLYRTRKFWNFWSEIKSLLPKKPEHHQIVDDRKEMEAAEQVIIEWPVDLDKPMVGLVQDWKFPPYWTRYERFLRNNNFQFETLDIHRSEWLDHSRQFNVILWATTGGMTDIEEHKTKTFLLEKYYGISIFPSFETLMWNENKIYQYDWMRMFNFPVIDTFISYSYPEVAEKISNIDYPRVVKTPLGAGSLGVEKIDNRKQALSIAKEAFSPFGRKTFWPYYRQKDFVFFQKFQPNDGYDLRVIVVGNKAFGYYRDVPKNEFRASGMGLVRKAAIPEDALRLAMQLVRTFNLEIAAVDMLRDTDGKLQIIEVSANITVETAGQLHIDGVPGAYIFEPSGSIHFEPCKYWIQELALYEFFKKYIHKHSKNEIDKPRVL